MGANFGKNYKISIFGESHGSALGINIDGAGFELYFRRNEKKGTWKNKTEYSES